MEPIDGVTTHTLLDDEFDCTIHRFVKLFWEEPTFPSRLLTEKIWVKDLVVTPWELMSIGTETTLLGSSSSSASSIVSPYPRYTRRVTSRHPIPGFSWLPWLPGYTNTDKREILEYNADMNELTIVEFSKVEGIPWHDIDVNLKWTVSDVSESRSHSRIHVLVQVQIVFHAGFLQIFAEAQAINQLLAYFGIWQVDAKKEIADKSSIADTPPDGRSPLALTIDQLMTASKTVISAQPTDRSVKHPNAAGQSLSGSEFGSTISDDVNGTWRTVWGFPNDLREMKDIQEVDETNISVVLPSEFIASASTSTVGAMSDIYYSRSGSATYSECEVSSAAASSAAATVGTATSTVSDAHLEAQQSTLLDTSGILSSMQHFGLSIWRVGDLLKL